MSLHGQETLPHVTTFLGKISTNAKVVISIDFGTTYSAVSFVYTSNPSVVNCGAPGLSQSRDSVKVPTLLLQHAEGWLFGQEAIDTYNDLVEECHDQHDDTTNPGDLMSEKGIHLYRFFKLGLKNQESGVETLMAKSTSGHKHKLIDLVTHSLEALSKFAMKEVQSGYGGALGITEKDIQWVLTVPAIWNDFGKAFMRKASYRAGIISDEASEKLLLALEPECASIAVHQGGHELGIFKEESIFMVLDCGGGTVDITLHRVASLNPLVLDEVAPPTGGAWGGIFVDLEFEMFLKKFLGAGMLQRLKNRYPTEVEEIKEQFRQLKESFGRGRNGKKANRISFAELLRDDIRTELGLSDLTKLAEDYNFNSGALEFDLNDKQVVKQMRRDNLILSNKLMLSFFEPTLQKICGCVKGILEQNSQVSVIALVGGYGASEVLNERIRSTFGASPFNKIVVRPDGAVSPQAAIVHGASYFGLYTRVIGVRLSTKSYGIGTSEAWYEGSRFLEKEATWDSTLEEMRVFDVFSSIVKHSTRIKPGEAFKRGPYKPLYPDQKTVLFEVYQSDLYSPKFTTQDCQKLGEITVPCRNIDDKFYVHFTFGTELRVEIVRQGDGDRHFTKIEIDY